MHFKMSAICLNLDQSKILLSGNEFSHPYSYKRVKNVIITSVKIEHLYYRPTNNPLFEPCSCYQYFDFRGGHNLAPLSVYIL